MAGNYIERLKQRQAAATGEPEPKAPEPEALPAVIIGRPPSWRP